MATITIYGSSDDLIEVEDDGGGISDEFASYNKASFLHFSEGTIVKCEYSPKGYEGKWRIERVASGKMRLVKHEAAKNDEDDYSDKLTLRGEVDSVECWGSKSPSSDEYAARIQEVIDRGVYDQLHKASIQELREVYRILKR